MGKQPCSRIKENRWEENCSRIQRVVADGRKQRVVADGEKPCTKIQRIVADGEQPIAEDKK
jgi:hypothetical protein